MHRTLISKYALIGGRDVENRMAKKLNVEARHAEIERRIVAHGTEIPDGTPIPRAEKIEIAPKAPYNVGKTQTNRRRLCDIMEQHSSDPAMKVRF